jgi:predicted Zn-dependent peptidase
LEDLGRSIITFGKVKSPEEICADIDAVTEDDIRRVASEMLKTNPTVAAYGNVSRLPRYDQIINSLAK